jgi:GNAT superfamily N-acetyltransferase
MVTQQTDAVTADLPVRRLSAADLPGCLELAADRSWPREERKWRLLFEVGEVYGIDDPAGGLAGAVVLTRYGPGLAAIGMMLVAARYGRRGLGSRLMTHALGQAAGAVFYLSATGYWRPLYQKLGFTSIDVSVMHAGLLRGEPAGRPAGALRTATDADLESLTAIDAEVFGAARWNILTRIFSFGERVVVAEDRGAITGFASAWRNVNNLVVGPVVVPDLPTACALICAVAGESDGPVRLDVLGRHAGLSEWAVASGLDARDETALMVHGGRLPGDRGRLFAPVSVAIG